MATYSLSSYHLELVMGDTDLLLKVLNDQNQLVTSYNLMTSSNCVTLTVQSGAYVIDVGTSISSSEEPHKHEVGGDNSQSIEGSTLTGIGIMDLRDMGRSGSLTATYDLTCCTMRLDGKDGTYPLWIKIPNLDCVTVEPPLS